MKTGEFRAVTSVLSVSEERARQLESGLQVLISERVNGTEERHSGSKRGVMPPLPATCDRNTIPEVAQSAASDSRKNKMQRKPSVAVSLLSEDEFDVIEDPGVEIIDTSDGELDRRVQLMLLMLPQLNCAIRERMDVGRAPFNTSVQSKVCVHLMRS